MVEYEAIKQKEEAKKKEQKYLEDQRKYLEESSRKGQENLNAERSRSRSILEIIFFQDEKNDRIKYKQQMVDDVDQRLKQTKNEAAKLEEDLKKIEMEFTKSLNEITVTVGKNIENDEAIKLLKKGMGYLSEIQQSWNGIAGYFQTVNNIISEATSKKYQDFIKEAEIVDGELIDILSSTILQSCGLSHLLSHITGMYVNVSNKYIMNNVAGMQRMIALPDHQLAAAQMQLKADCKKASKGIAEMVVTDKRQMIQDMEDYKEQQSVE